MNYHEQLIKAGADSHLLHFADMIHAFMNMENLCPEQCQRLYQAIGDFVS